MLIANRYVLLINPEKKNKKKKHRINVKKKTKKENLHEIELALLHKFGLLLYF